MSGEIVPIDPFTLTDEQKRALPDRFEFLLSRRFTDGCAYAHARAKAGALRQFCAEMMNLGYDYSVTDEPPFTHYLYVFNRSPRPRSPALPDNAIDV